MRPRDSVVNNRILNAPSGMDFGLRCLLPICLGVSFVPCARKAGDAMKLVSAIIVLSLISAAAMPAASFAESLVSGSRSGVPVFPYKDLPGVLTPHSIPEESAKCHTATGRLRGIGGALYHDLPELTYVCEKDGVISSGNYQPRGDYWQYNNPRR